MKYNKYVEQVQMDLVVAGYSVGKHGIDGKFGKDTLSAVNEAIADALECDDDPDDDYPFIKGLKYGALGEGVENLQKLLEKWNMKYYLGAGYIDGIFGKGTKEAVMEFQKAMSKKPDGKVDEELWKLLKIDPIDISFWTTPQVSKIEGDNGKLPLACNCNGKYCDSAGNAVPGKTSVGLMILLVRIENELNARFKRDDIKVRLTDDMNLNDHDDANGGNRCKEWNAQHGGAKKSQHIVCKAADIYFVCPDVKGKERPTMHDMWMVADDLNPYGGVGEYKSNIHVDTRGNKARWSKGV